MDSTNNVFNFPIGTLVILPTLGQEAMSVVFELRWMLVAIFTFMLIDTAFSYAEHIKNVHENKAKETEWTSSGCVRRLGGKVGTYLSFLIIGCFLGLSCFEPLGWCNHVMSSAIGALVGLACEVVSIGGHYLHIKNIYVSLSPTRFVRSIIIALVRAKSDTVGDALEKELKIEKKRNGKH